MVSIKWLGHASFILKGEKAIYIDPYKIESDIPADIILLTHPHFDHCSGDDILTLANDSTEIIGPPDCKGVTQRISPGETMEVNGIKIEAVPAYNLTKDFHPKFNNWVGYVITIDGKRIYHAGDTDFIPEMRLLKDIDTALLPVGGTYTMDAAEAAKAADVIKAKVAIPMHYGKIVGSKSDAERFRELYKGKVDILSPS